MALFHILIAATPGLFACDVYFILCFVNGYRRDLAGINLVHPFLADLFTVKEDFHLVRHLR